MTDPFLSDSDPRRPHDQREGTADAASTGSFWGDQAEWSPTGAEHGERNLSTGAIGRWWESVTGGRSRADAVRSRRRAHLAAAAEHRAESAPTPVALDTETFTDAARPHDAHSGDDLAPEARGDSSIGDLEAGDDWSGAWEPEPSRTGVDPLLARLGGLAIIITLLVPVIMGFASNPGTDDALPDGAPSGTILPFDTSETVAAAPTTVPTNVTPATPAAETPITPTPATAGSAVTSPIEPAEPATSAATAALAVDQCGRDYDIVAGDFWIRIADGAGVDVATLLAVNDATQATPLYPGRSICLPVGASTPPPPATTAPQSATVAPAPSSNAASAPTAPTPTTPPPPPPPASSNASSEEVQAIIRAVWPDELEEKALEIAWRESNYRPTAKNFCCYGVFQVYWEVHRGWLGSIGITSPEQLYDPTLNARAALALYERSGGWGPWGG